MSELISDHNKAIVAEFRENEGRVGGPFAGHPMLLLHHRGVRSGEEYVSPLACLPGEEDTLYVFASAAGQPADPQWYRNIVAAGKAEVEYGTERFPVAVTELEGAERERVFGEQKQRMPGFAEYERRVSGIRTIPVVALRRL